MASPKKVKPAKSRRKVPSTQQKAAAEKARARLRGSVLQFDRPLDPVFDPMEWDVNKN